MGTYREATSSKVGHRGYCLIGFLNGVKGTWMIGGTQGRTRSGHFLGYCLVHEAERGGMVGQLLDKGEVILGNEDTSSMNWEW